MMFAEAFLVHHGKNAQDEMLQTPSFSRIRARKEMFKEGNGVLHIVVNRMFCKLRIDEKFSSISDKTIVTNAEPSPRKSTLPRWLWYNAFKSGSFPTNRSHAFLVSP
jgi:hypothetical protein